MGVRYLRQQLLRFLTRQLSNAPQEKIKVHVRQGLGQHKEKKKTQPTEGINKSGWQGEGYSQCARGRKTWWKEKGSCSPRVTKQT